MGKIESVTQRDLLRTVAARWKTQYSRGADWKFPWALLRYEQLKALGSEPTAEQVLEVVGNGSWARFLCGGCTERCTAVVRYEDVNSDEYGDSVMCIPCVRRMARVAGLLDDAKKEARATA